MTSKISLWQLIRLVFILFSLYLLGDAFFRWDGFSLHSTFMEFMPGVALALILWSIVAVFMAIFIWLFLSLIKLACHRMGFQITIEQLLVYMSVFVVLGALTWKVKQFFWPLVPTSQLIKYIVLLSVSFLSILPSWLMRDRADIWGSIIHEHITPLVYLFGMLLLLSFPLVTYHAWFKDTDKMMATDVPQPSMQDNKRPNIILMTIDTLSAKDMSVYGYHRPTTPYIKKWAKEATLFTNLEAESNWTIPTTASLMTGKRVWTHRAAQLQGAKPLKSDIESLPLVLKKNGYYNMAFVANTLASVEKLGVSNSFDIAPDPIEFSAPQSFVGDGVLTIGIVDRLLYKVFSDGINLYDWILKDDFIFGKVLNVISRNISSTTTPPDKVFKGFFDALKNNPPTPYFAWIHIFPPHLPYLPPESFRGVFNPSSKLRTFKTQDAVRLETHKYLFKFQPYPPEMQPTMDILRSYYDEYIRYCDKEFERFIEQLTAENKLGNTVFILSADHGESFENGYFTHGGPFINEAVSHIPLIIKRPDQNEGQIIHELIEQVDISATILNLAGISTPSWMEGHSLVPLMNGESLFPKPAFSVNLRMNETKDNKIPDGSYAVWEGDYKLVYILEGAREWFFLYNLKKDPGELRNIFEKERDKGRDLLDMIFNNLKDANKKIGSGTAVTDDLEST